MTISTAMIGLVVLLGLALAVGASMDTFAADVRWQRVAAERRQQNEERKYLEVLRHTVHEERRRLAEEQEALRAVGRRSSLCSRCPLRAPPPEPPA